MAKQKLDPRSLGLACGIVTGAWLFLATLYGMLTGEGTIMLGIIADMYPGYNLSLTGAVLGAIYGFIEAGVVGYVFAWLYNKL